MYFTGFWIGFYYTKKDFTIVKSKKDFTILEKNSNVIPIALLYFTILENNSNVIPITLLDQ